MNNQTQKSRLGWLLIASLGLNVFFFLSPKNNSKQVLASAGSESFRRSDLSQSAQDRLASLDGVVQQTLKGEAENWIENFVLPKEAQSRGITVQELLDQEISQKVQVSPEEVLRRRALAPSADALPYPQVLKNIESDLGSVRSRALKKQFVQSLYPKYKASVKLAAADGPSAAAAGEMSRFPAYAPPANGDPSKGPADAPVTVEIYSDFMCPYSARFFNTMTEVEKQYPGKVRTVFHQFPLPFHNGAHLMAEASFCAQEQGKFWEYHDRLMSEPKGKIEKGGLVQIAEQLGLAAPAFQACLDSGKNAARVDQNIMMGKAAGVSGTPGYRINGRIGSGAVPFEALKPLIDWCLSPQGPYPGAKNPAAPPSGAPAAGRSGLDAAKTYTLDPEWLKKSPSQGPEKAPVTLVEFVDYNCPFCQRGSGTIEKIMSQYQGKIRLISKQFPLPMHPNAMKAAIASSCAAEQGKFWEYRKELFGDSWGKQSVEDLKAAARKTGLNEKTFNDCLDQEKTKALVMEDMQKASGLGAQGMPTYFINGTPVVGAQPIENFQKIIDAKLSAEKK